MVENDLLCSGHVKNVISDTGHEHTVCMWVRKDRPTIAQNFECKECSVDSSNSNSNTTLAAPPINSLAHSCPLCTRVLSLGSVSRSLGSLI